MKTEEKNRKAAPTLPTGEAGAAARAHTRLLCRVPTPTPGSQHAQCCTWPNLAGQPPEPLNAGSSGTGSFAPRFAQLHSGGKGRGGRGEGSRESCGRGSTATAPLSVRAAIHCPPKWALSSSCAGVPGSAHITHPKPSTNKSLLVRKWFFLPISTSKEVR